MITRHPVSGERLVITRQVGRALSPTWPHLVATQVSASGRPLKYEQGNGYFEDWRVAPATPVGLGQLLLASYGSWAPHLLKASA